MKTKNEYKQKQNYSPPKIEYIKLDNEISLVLQSNENPMEEPNWSKVPEYSNCDPYKLNVS
jgi:hypothetical protein